MPLLVLASEPVASRRRVFFQLVAADGISPALSEAGGQPQASSDGAAWTATGVGTLVAVGSGRYYADLTALLVATPGARIETRYKSASTAECPGDTVAVVAGDPYKNPLDAARVGGRSAREALAAVFGESAGSLAPTGTPNQYQFTDPDTGAVLATVLLTSQGRAFTLPTPAP